jgi:hypothetical protein
MNLWLLSIWLDAFRATLPKPVEAVRAEEPILSIRFRRPGGVLLFLGVPVGPWIGPGSVDPWEGAEGIGEVRDLRGTSLVEAIGPDREGTVRLRFEGRGRPPQELRLPTRPGPEGPWWEGGGRRQALFPGRPAPVPGDPLPPVERALESLAAEGEAAERAPGLSSLAKAVFSWPEGTWNPESFSRFLRELLGGGAFRLVYRGRLAEAVPAPATGDLPEGLHALGPFASLEEGMVAAGDRLLAEADARFRATLVRPLRKRLASRERLLERLARDLETARTHRTIRQEAELLAAFRHRVPPGAREVVLEDITSDGRPRTIRLDPSLPLEQQIARRFRRAAKLARSLEAIEKRRGQVEREAERLRETIEGIERAASIEEARDLARAAGVAPSTAPSRRTARDTPPKFRRYDLGRGWFVLVGRNDRENDRLTFQIASPTDRWFHAQGIAGSHVILKAEGGRGAPPRKILEAAASVAAFYSKARHASVVPVMVTERRYVRKPRKAPPGTVRCERYETLFVEPALPPSSGKDGPDGEGPVEEGP